MSNVRTLSRLSQRERECIKFIAKGYTAKRIGKELQISNRTVEAHLENVKRKLACQNRSELMFIVAQMKGVASE